MTRLPFTRHELSRRGLAWGALAATGMALFYATVLIVAAGVGHLVDQIVLDWYWLVLVIPGFGLQVTLLVEMRQRHSSGMAVAGVGSASSAAGMVACCAHHLAELAPLVGLAGFAGFLTAWKPWLLAAGVTITYTMIVRSWRHFVTMSIDEVEACAVAH